MPIQLRTAMQEFLDGWQSDLPDGWRSEFGSVNLDLDAVAPDLTLEPWEPIFPVRRGKIFPGMPRGAHLLRAFDGLEPCNVRCVILGQDPYPDPGFATGRAFEAGNLSGWRELDKMFSRSLRAYLQMLLAARSGDMTFARSFDDWTRALDAIEQGELAVEIPDQLADYLESQGVLLLNVSLTLTRFAVQPGPHQTHGHLPLWRPLIEAVLSLLMAREAPLVIIGFGDAAADMLETMGISAKHAVNTASILRPHPADADAVLALPNPFLCCNAELEKMGASPIDW